MELAKPAINGFTIYSKSGCKNCSEIKNYLTSKNYIFTEVNCDENLIEDKEGFLTIMEYLCGEPVKIFPILFFDGKFIGGYNKAMSYIAKMEVTFNENLVF